MPSVIHNVDIPQISAKLHPHARRLSPSLVLVQHLPSDGHWVSAKT